MKLSIDRVSFGIGDAIILDGVTGELESGESVGIIGPNGAGKTTLADLISGFSKPSAGKILLDGLDLTLLTPAEIGRVGVSRMFQGSHLAWNLTARENVQAVLDSRKDQSWRGAIFESQPSKNLGCSGQDMALNNLERVGLIGEQETPARDLSFGQQRLLALARSLAYPSKLLLLDEPFTGVKGAALARILGILGEEAAQGRMILVIDHALSAIQSTASRLWFMHKGKLEVFSNYKTMVGSDVFVQSYLGLRNTVTDDSASQIEKRVIIKDVVLGKEVKRYGANDGPCGMSHEMGEVQSIDANPHAKTCSEIVLSLRDVSGGYGTKTIVRDINFDLFAGDVFCILGLNGSGKSTLLRIIAGIVAQFRGNISFDGLPIGNLHPDFRIRLGMRFLPQDHRIFRSLSIEENLILAVAPLEPQCTVPGLPLSAPGNSDLNAMCADFNTKELNVKRFAGTLSGGEQASVALAQLKYGSPKLLLLDEPTSGIDGITRSKLSTMIANWQGAGAAIIVVEHDILYSLSVASRVGILKDGMLKEVGPVNTLTPRELLSTMSARMGEG